MINIKILIYIIAPWDLIKESNDTEYIIFNDNKSSDNSSVKNKDIDINENKEEDDDDKESVDVSEI